MIQDFFNKLSANERKFFYIALLFALLAVFDRLFLGPVTSKLKLLDDAIEEQKNMIKGDLRLLSYKDKILKENDALKPFFAQKIQTEEEIIAAFLKHIEILATESKVNLIRVNPSDSKSKKGFIEYYANLECDGLLENVVKFMHSIDASEDLLKVVKFNMGPKKAGSEEVSASMTVVKIIVDSLKAQDMAEAGGVSSAGSSGNGSNGVAGGAGGQGPSGPAGSGTSSSNGSSQQVSERIGINADKFPIKSSAKKEKEEETDEIKPSIFEKIISKTEKPGQEQEEE